MLIFNQWKVYRPRQPKAIAKVFRFVKKRLGWADGALSPDEFHVLEWFYDGMHNSLAIDKQAMLEIVHTYLKEETSILYFSEQHDKLRAQGYSIEDAAEMIGDDERSLRESMSDYLRYTQYEERTHA